MATLETAIDFPIAGTGVIDRERIIAKPGFNRWMLPPAALRHGPPGLNRFISNLATSRPQGTHALRFAGLAWRSRQTPRA